MRGCVRVAIFAMIASLAGAFCRRFVTRGGRLAAQRRGDHHRRPGLWRPGRARQPQDQDAQPRRVSPAERPAQELLCFAGLLADPRQPVTGRYNYRTGVVDTYLGRSMMHPDEVTLAEMLAAAGLSDRHLRQVAPGRQRSVAAHRPGVSGSRWCSKGAGSASPPTRPAAAATSTRSCSTTANAERSRAIAATSSPRPPIDFISEPEDRPFFAYLAFNCPHTPLLAPEPELATYRAMNLALKEFPQLGQPIPPGFAAPAENVARVYAMVTNIDTNVGKVLKALEAKGSPRTRSSSS